MTEPLFTVRDLGVEPADTGDKELLRNYAFNISQGIVQRVSRYFDALALMDERGEAPPARGEGGKYADSARGGVMGFGHKRNVCNQEKSAHTVEQQVSPAVKAEKERIQKLVTAAVAGARTAAEQSAEVAALRAKVEELQALAALCSSAPYLDLDGPPPPPQPPHLFRPPQPLHPTPYTLSASYTQSVASPPLHHLCPPQEQAARR